MVYIESWNEYQKLAEELYEKHPTRTRYCVKYRGADGTLVLKVTDDNTTLKYKTRSSIMLNRFEAFNLSIMSKMQNRRRPQAHVLLSTTPAQAGVPADTHGHSAGGAGTMSDVVMADTPAAQTGTAGGAGAGGGGAKKKKPKKKK